jgi:hypothetical protein
MIEREILSPGRYGIRWGASVSDFGTEVGAKGSSHRVDGQERDERKSI